MVLALAIFFCFFKQASMSCAMSKPPFQDSIQMLTFMTWKSAIKKSLMCKAERCLDLLAIRWYVPVDTSIHTKGLVQKGKFLSNKLTPLFLDPATNLKNLFCKKRADAKWRPPWKIKRYQKTTTKNALALQRLRLNRNYGSPVSIALTHSHSLSHSLTHSLTHFGPPTFKKFKEKFH